MKAKEKIEYLINNSKKIGIDLTAACHCIIEQESPEQGAELFRFFIEKRKEASPFGEKKIELPHYKGNIDDELRRVGLLLEEKLEELLQQWLPEAEFYMQLWENINELNEDLQIGAIHYCTLDKRFPYYYIDTAEAVKMNQIEYTKVMSAIGDEAFNKMEYILKSDMFTQKTEKSSLILNIMENLNYKEKCVFLARLMVFYDVKMVKLLISK